MLEDRLSRKNKFVLHVAILELLLTNLVFYLESAWPKAILLKLQTDLVTTDLVMYHTRAERGRILRPGRVFEPRKPPRYEQT